MHDLKTELLKAATFVFAQRGYRGASTRAIAKLAEANEGSIYRLFGSKQKLYFEVLKCKAAEAARFIASRMQSSPQEILRAWIEASKTDLIAMRLLHFAILEGMPESRNLLQPSASQVYLPLAEYVDLLKERGMVRRDVPTRAAAAALASLGACHMFFELLGDGDRFAWDEPALPQLCAQLWLHGVGGAVEAEGGQDAFESASEAGEGCETRTAGGSTQESSCQ